MNKTGLRLGLLVILIIASNLSCVNTPTAQTVRPSTSPDLSFTSTVEAPASEKILLPSLTATLQPRTATATIQPTEVSFKLLPDLFSQSTITPLDIVQEMVGRIDKDRILTDLRRLTGEVPICTDNGCYTITDRLTGGEGLKWAKDYIYKELTDVGYSVEFQDWSLEGKADQNLIVRKPGIFFPGEEVYFVAHLDGAKKGAGSQFPAADDNASGAVDILELARIMSSYSFSRTLVLFFSTGEEQGALGVRSYLNKLTPEKLSSIRAVVNIDMIGYDNDRDGVMELWSGDHPPSLALTNVMSDTIRAYQLNLIPRIVTGCD